MVPRIGAAFSFFAGGAPDPKMERVARALVGGGGEAALTDFVPVTTGALGLGAPPPKRENAGFFGAGAGAGVGSTFFGAGFGAENPKRGLGTGLGTGAGAAATFAAGLGAEPNKEKG